MGKQHHDLTGRAMSSVALEALIVDNAPDCDRELLALWQEFMAAVAQRDAHEAAGREREEEECAEREVYPRFDELCRLPALGFVGLAVKAACLLHDARSHMDFSDGHPVADLIRTTEKLLAGLSLAEDVSGRPISLLGHRR